ncbi:RnfABCDGE type electron transport complex subunit B [Legionella taurinensis]|uniref:RnfABCDGE type electron transport complex subunit B n=1 Tax=Legionella taurinensis TaxID=70611 RepID=A0A3A5L1R0_9GAMM|nr:RnfABCDGE type electron transport complex subunit B [Legionella taurinensis]MDX1836116.1 RnfABCDGE type electron transport complex subunit B [Legionella taurinensis]PUT42110.1 [Fe-S]-binding protein [Legionella taurinensis]PUT44897.1 [Fe-S]-binding protein [Legionella taurinensis]PUT48219.1 [Fe-S]-binding protein [Legionella taurinensis]PUT49032.1 [Fe-S]-binding protein [Legionella taurinensis]
MATVEDIDARLPQTQCGECSYAGCLPYAEALAHGTATIDRCPPGGVNTVKALGQLLNVDVKPLLAAVELNTRAPAFARIREAECIGCTKCIQACPVDAILGSAKRMHAVITHECTGCGLCVEPCPVDCIDLHPLEEPQYDRQLARQRHRARQTRLLREEHEKQQQYRQKSRLALQESNQQDLKAKQEYILQALARVEAKKKTNG